MIDVFLLLLNIAVAFWQYLSWPDATSAFIAGWSLCAAFFLSCDIAKKIA